MKRTVKKGRRALHDEYAKLVKAYNNADTRRRQAEASVGRLRTEMDDNRRAVERIDEGERLAALQRLKGNK